MPERQELCMQKPNTVHGLHPLSIYATLPADRVASLPNWMTKMSVGALDAARPPCETLPVPNGEASAVAGLTSVRLTVKSIIGLLAGPVPAGKSAAPPYFHAKRIWSAPVPVTVADVMPTLTLSALAAGAALTRLLGALATLMASPAATACHESSIWGVLLQLLGFSFQVYEDTAYQQLYSKAVLTMLGNMHACQTPSSTKAHLDTAAVLPSCTRKCAADRAGVTKPL